MHPELLDFPIIYAIGRDGKTFFKLPGDLNEAGDTSPLFETIVKTIPNASKGTEKPFQMLVSAFERMNIWDGFGDGKSKPRNY